MLTSALVLGLLGGAALVYCTMVVAFMAEDLKSKHEGVDTYTALTASLVFLVPYAALSASKLALRLLARFVCGLVGVAG